MTEAFKDTAAVMDMAGSQSKDPVAALFEDLDMLVKESEKPEFISNLGTKVPVLVMSPEIFMLYVTINAGLRKENPEQVLPTDSDAATWITGALKALQRGRTYPGEFTYRGLSLALDREASYIALGMATIKEAVPEPISMGLAGQA